MNVQEVMGPGFGTLPERERLRRAAEELEAVVLAQLLGTMRRSVPAGEGLLPRSFSEDVFRSLLDRELARVAARRSPLGMAEAIVARFEKHFKGMSESTEIATEGMRDRALSSASTRSWRI